MGMKFSTCNWRREIVGSRQSIVESSEWRAERGVEKRGERGERESEERVRVKGGWGRDGEEREGEKGREGERGSKER